MTTSDIARPLPGAGSGIPFNGDGHLTAHMLRLRDRHQLAVFFETGTYYGDTSSAMAAHFQQVVTVETNQAHVMQAARLLKGLPNVLALHMDSRAAIRRQGKAEGRTLFFLDAHWGADVPLLGELEEIAQLGLRPVIVIHDFYVPGKSTTEAAPFGYDSYHGQRFDWNYIQRHVEAIYGADGYAVSYPEEVEGAARGHITLEPIKP